MEKALSDIIKAATLGFAIAVTSINSNYSFILGSGINLWCKDGHMQDIVDDPDFGAHFIYGYFENDVYCDHNNQGLSNLKNIKEDDTISIVYHGKVTQYNCICVEEMIVDMAGQIRDEAGNYMGDSFGPCTVIYTCKGSKRLVTIWEEKYERD